MFRRRSRPQWSLDDLTARVEEVHSSTDQISLTLQTLMSEKHAERAKAESRRRKILISGFALAAISGCASAYLLMSSLPASPTSSDPGRIGIVLPEDAADSFLVDTYFDVSREDAAEFKIVVSAFPSNGVAQASTSVGFLFCGAVRNGLQLSEANTHESPIARAITRSTIETDSRLGYRSKCDYVMVTTSTWQVILSGSSDQALTTSAGSKVLYALPGVTTTGVEEEIDGTVLYPMPKETTVTVSMDSVPVDLTVNAAAPQIPAGGRLSWSSSGAEGFNLPSEYRVSGSLGNRANETQSALFAAGLLGGFAGAALIWALEAFVDRRPKASRS
jgi:hypothetical protein